MTQNSRRRQQFERRRLYARQAVTLTGLSSDIFQKAITNLREILTTITGHFPDDSVNHWEPATYEGHLALDIHTRYFTSRRNAPNETSLPFMKGVDPDGILALARKQDLIHGPDNQVQYLKMITSDNMEGKDER